jgi:hypothetical protein
MVAAAPRAAPAVGRPNAEQMALPPSCGLHKSRSHKLRSQPGDVSNQGLQNDWHAFRKRHVPTRRDHHWPWLENATTTAPVNSFEEARTRAQPLGTSHASEGGPVSAAASGPWRAPRGHPQRQGRSYYHGPPAPMRIHGLPGLGRAHSDRSVRSRTSAGACFATRSGPGSRERAGPG